MAVFIKDKNNDLINLYYVQDVFINPDNDKELIFYKVNGEIVLETYDTSEEAEEAYNTYKTSMKESSGSQKVKELQEQVKELSNTVQSQQEEITGLEDEVSDLNDEIDSAEDLTKDILGIAEI